MFSSAQKEFRRFERDSKEGFRSPPIEKGVDVVYMWIDLRDPVLRAKRREWMGRCGLDSGALGHWSTTRDNQELRHSLRSLERNMPWVRKVYIVTNGQTPEWLDTQCPQVEVVFEEKIMGSNSPVFNGHAIMLNMHRIPGISDWFLQMDDDFFLGRPVGLEDFFCSRTQRQLCHLSVARRNASDPKYGLPRQAALSHRDLGFRHPAVYTHWASHMPRLWNKQVIEEMWERWPEDFAQVSAHKFRCTEDIDLTSFYPYYASRCGKATVMRPSKTPVVHIELHGSVDSDASALRRAAETHSKFIVLQDERKASTDPESESEYWNQTYGRFFQGLYPEASSFER